MMLRSLIFLFSVFILFSGCNNSHGQKGTQLDKNTDILRTLDDQNYTVVQKGNDFIIDTQKDKVILFDLFATWCLPCRNAISHINSLSKKYKGRLLVIGLNVEEAISKEKLGEFVKKYDVSYHLVSSSNSREFAQKIAKSLGYTQSIPIPLIVLYKNGKYIIHYSGEVEEEFIDSDIREALGGK